VAAKTILMDVSYVSAPLVWVLLFSDQKIMGSPCSSMIFSLLLFRKSSSVSVFLVLDPSWFFNKAIAYLVGAIAVLSERNCGDVWHYCVRVFGPKLVLHDLVITGLNFNYPDHRSSRLDGAMAGNVAVM